MQLTLYINEKEKIYDIGFVSGLHFRKVNEFDETIDYSDISIEEMDKLVGFVCDVYGNQFDINEFYEGIPSHQVISTITDVFVRVRTGKTPEELEKESKENEEGNEEGK
ncbi:phage tail assembly chaperone G [Gracilibacillus sp. HCP3S3_G5_1]|uniref:phage tail assembly chaperone G n=1 Tax=unclassified Gracilibacillus TaxID=2625209 RepID=UPI003F8A9342